MTTEPLYTGGKITCNVVQESCEKEDWCNMIITITDNGIGMSEEFQKHIFEDFERELLTEQGCIVETADDGVACIDMIEKAEADYYKIILMDIQMPIMNGYDAALAIRKMKDTKKSRIPIIAMTANIFAEDIQKILSVGMNGHIAKPIQIDKLLSILSEIIRQQEK